ncbi:hypothetical protein RB595_009978 [Gaeumannomyces hyphopodioides]
MGDGVKGKSSLIGTKRKRKDTPSLNDSQSPSNSVTLGPVCSMAMEAATAARTRHNRREITAELKERVTRTPSPPLERLLLRLARSVTPPSFCTGKAAETHSTRGNPPAKKKKKKRARSQTNKYLDAAESVDTPPPERPDIGNQAAISPRHSLQEPVPPVDTPATGVIPLDSSMTVATSLDTEEEVTNTTMEPLVLAMPTPLLLPKGQWSPWEEPTGYSAECAWLPTTSIPLAPAEAVGHTFDGYLEAQEYTTALEAASAETGENEGYEASAEYLWVPQQPTEVAFLGLEALQQDSLDWDALVPVSYLEKLPLHTGHTQALGSASISVECDASLGQPWSHSHPGVLAQPHLVSTSGYVGIPEEETGGEPAPHAPMAFLPGWS